MPESRKSEMSNSQKYEVYVEKEIDVGHLTVGIHGQSLHRYDVGVQTPKDLLSSGFDKQKYLLSASLLVSVKQNVIQNSPMLIDQITKVFIPRVEVTFPQDTYHIAKIISIVTQHPEPTKSYDKKKRSAYRYFKIASLIKEIGPMLADIEKEHDYHGERDPKKVCRHCVLKYRKATSVLQVIIGDYGKFENIIDSFHLGGKQIGGSQNGIAIKLPISIDTQEIPLSIEIPFLMLVQEEGPFKDNMVVFTDKIESVNRDKFYLKIKPYYTLTNSDSLFSQNFTKTLWKKFIDYYKCLSGTAVGEDRHLQNLFQESTQMSEFSDKPRNPIHLLFFRRSFNNKAMLGYLDGVQKDHIDAFYKQCIISKFKKIDVESNDIAAFSSTFNIVTNIMLNSDLERFVEYLLRPIQATGLYRRKLIEEERRAQEDADLNRKNATKQNLVEREIEERYEEDKSQIELELGPVIEYKDVFTFNELFLQLQLDFSVNDLQLKVNFDDKKSNVKILICFSCSNIRVSVNLQGPLVDTMLTGQESPSPNKAENYVSVDNIKLVFGDNTLLVQQLALDYLALRNSFDFRLGYFTVENRESEATKSQRLLQIGLDDIRMSKDLQYFAFQSEISFDAEDVLQSKPLSLDITMDVKHSRIVLSNEVISRVIRMLEVIKKTLLVYKIQIFNSMWKKYSVDFKDLSPEDISELVIKEASLLPISVLNKLLMQEKDQKVSQKDETVKEMNGSTLKINLKCHSISLLLQFCEGVGPAKVP